MHGTITKQTIICPGYGDARKVILQHVLWFDGCHSRAWIDGPCRSRQLGCEDDANATHFLESLRACAQSKDLQAGARLHDELSERGLLGSCSEALVSMYARCGDLAKARQLFETHKTRDVFTWTALIAGYVENGMAHDAFSMFQQMQLLGLSPNATTFSFVVKACGSLKEIALGEKIHDAIAGAGLLANNAKLGTALMGMYIKCGALLKAHRVLEELPVRDVVAWNALISGYVENNRDEQALCCFQQMQQEGITPDAITVACILKACGRMGSSDLGEKIYREFSKEGLLEKHTVLGHALVDMYARCGAFLNAQQALRELPVRNVISWNILMSGYVKHGKNREVLSCFQQLQDECISPDAVTFACVLKACANMGAIDMGEKIHEEIVECGLLRSSIKLGTTLVDFYAKCGAFTKAWQVLEELPVHNVTCWNALIAGYVEHDIGEEALNCLKYMQYEGLFPDEVTFTCVLKACGISGDIIEGEKVHDEIVKQGLLANNDALGNALVGMYAKFGALSKAEKVLKELPACSVISWNSLIHGYIDLGNDDEALRCFEQMQVEKVSGDAVTFANVLNACGNTGALDKGERLHESMVRQKILKSHPELGNALIDMYAKCGAFQKAIQVLEEIHNRDILAWNALIRGYVEHDEGYLALTCFEQLQEEGLLPDAVTCLWILKACGITGEIDRGEKLHHWIAKRGWLQDNTVLATALVGMYATCGVLQKAHNVHEKLSVCNVMSWNALIAGCVKHADAEQALMWYTKMHQENISPDPFTFSCVLKACGCIGAVQVGEQICKKILIEGLLGNNTVLGTALVDMYSKCGHFSKAHLILEELPVRNTVSWNALIAGYVEHGKGKQALKCFKQMEWEGLSASPVTLICLLKACGSIGAANEGIRIHNEIANQDLLGKDVALDTALLDMYGKCRALAKAKSILEELPVKTVASWNTLIARYCDHEEAELALSSFEQMQHEGFNPDSVTFTCALKACGAIGAANIGERIHVEIAKECLLADNSILSTALMDMYAKCDKMAKAQQVLENCMAWDSISWNVLIAGLAYKGEVIHALHCFERMLQEGFSPDLATFSIVLSACSHSGLLEIAQVLFRNMNTKYGIAPDLEHYACMVDIFGRSGHLDKAAEIIKELPPHNSGIWATLLGACHKWGDIYVGSWAFEHALEVDTNDAAIYVLMANIYSAAGIQEAEENIEVISLISNTWIKQAYRSVGGAN